MSVAIAVLSTDSAFARRATSVIRSALADSWRPSIQAEDGIVFDSHPTLARILENGRRLLLGHPDAGPLYTVSAADEQELAGRLRELRERDPSIVLCQLLLQLSEVDAAAIDRRIQAVLQSVRDHGVETLPTPYFAHVFMPEMPQAGPFNNQPSAFIPHLPHDEAWVQDATILCGVFDLLEGYWFSPRIRRMASDAPQELTFSRTLFDFLRSEEGDHWQLWYYTGSAISSTIDTLEHLARSINVPCLRGPNEHSLAVGAVASWLLFRRPSVILLTSGMVDEFRGTLANLAATRARCLVVIPENHEDQWFAFQGTITPDFDSRAILQARRLPCVYIRSRDELCSGLESAFDHYKRGAGPVFLMVHQGVLDSTAPLPRPLQALASTSIAAPIAEEALVAAMRVINSDPADVMWHCGSISELEARRIVRIADAAGIALADSFIHPGAIPSHSDGRPTPNYLGTLGMYSVSPAVYRFFHDNGEVRPPDQVCLFELASRVAQGSIPFNQSFMKGRMRVVQVTREALHAAPFAQTTMVGEVSDFLDYVESHLKVDPGVLEQRRRRLATYRHVSWDLVSHIPALPMTANYFFTSLADLLRTMIDEDRYRYVGLSEVGRCGISAVHHLPRTQRGICGWYGRALMGDATMSTIAAAALSEDDVILIQGDGARQMVPDPIPAILENESANARARKPTITFMNFVNGSLSVIQTYQQRVARRKGGRQMQLYSPVPEEGLTTVGSRSILHRTFDRFDAAAIRSALLERNRINVLSVILTHNNEADGLGLASAAGWQRPDPAYGATWK